MLHTSPLSLALALSLSLPLYFLLASSHSFVTSLLPFPFPPSTLSGEVHPKSLRRVRWLQRIIDICSMCLDRGFLPHTNVGPLSLGVHTA